MRIFLDTADIDEIRAAARWGIVSGVTTNPTLLSKSAGKSHEAIIQDIADVAKAGADIATIPPDVFKSLLNHPLTDKGLAAFVADAKKAGITIK